MQGPHPARGENLLDLQAGKVSRCVFRISVAGKVFRPRWFPDGEAIPEQNQLGGTVIPGKGHRDPFMQSTDEICNQF